VKITVTFLAAIILGALALISTGRNDAHGANPNPVRLDHSLRPCAESFATYSLGSSFAGLPMTHHSRACSRSDPTRTQASGGDIDPDSLVRANYDSYIYGTCHATSDMGCAPPLEIQTWPACERSAADYNFGPPGAAETIQPVKITRIRGVPARYYDDVRLELSARGVTVVIFAHTFDDLTAAAEELRGVNGVGPGRGEVLPGPLEGAENGTLPC